MIPHSIVPRSMRYTIVTLTSYKTTPLFLPTLLFLLKQSWPHGANALTSTGISSIFLYSILYSSFTLYYTRFYTLYSTRILTPQKNTLFILYYILPHTQAYTQLREGLYSSILCFILIKNILYSPYTLMNLYTLLYTLIHTLSNYAYSLFILYLYSLPRVFYIFIEFSFFIEYNHRV